MSKVIIAILALAACVADPSLSQDMQASERPNYQWMVGVWDCRTSYHATPQAAVDSSYVMVGTYTAEQFSENVFGHYRETDDHVHGVRDYDDMWTIGSKEIAIPFNPDNVELHYEARSTTDSPHFFEILADGGIHDDVFPLPGTFGSAVLGVPAGMPDAGSLINDPTETPHRWSAIIGVFLQNGAKTLIRNWRVRISDTRVLEQIYVDDTCVRRQE